VPTRPPRTYAATLGLRGHHELLPGDHAAAERAARRERRAAAARRDVDARLPHAGPRASEPGRVELRRLGRALSSRRKPPELEHELLHEGRARRARARSRAAAR